MEVPGLEGILGCWMMEEGWGGLVVWWGVWFQFQGSVRAGLGQEVKESARESPWPVVHGNFGLLHFLLWVFLETRLPCPAQPSAFLLKKNVANASAVNNYKKTVLVEEHRGLRRTL